jgi:hypothetical protein
MTKPFEVVDQGQPTYVKTPKSVPATVRQSPPWPEIKTQAPLPENEEVKPEQKTEK